MDYSITLAFVLTLLAHYNLRALAMIEYDLSFVCRDKYEKTIHVPSPIYNDYSSSGILRLKFRSSRTTCSVTLIPPRDVSLLLSIRKIDLRQGCKDNITVTYDRYFSAYYCGDMNDEFERETVKSSSNMTIIFKSGDGFTPSPIGFEFIYTAYTSSLRCSSSDLYLCDNGHCIAELLKCDGHNHCGDRSDQNYCVPSAGAIAGYVIGSVILIVTVLGIVVCCIRKKRRRVATRTGRIIPTVQPVPTVHSPIRTAVQSYQQNPSFRSDAPPPYQQVITSYPPPTAYQPTPAAYQQTVPNYSTQDSSVPSAPPPAYTQSQPAYNADYK